VHERGSHGWSASVAPEGAERLELSTDELVVVVVVAVPPPGPVGTVEVVEDEPAPVFEEGTLVGGFTAKLEPVTMTTSALADRGSAEPTSIVLVVVEPAPRPLLFEPLPPVPPVPALTSPGS
jgi:hypothetical protein